MLFHFIVQKNDNVFAVKRKNDCHQRDILRNNKFIGSEDMESEGLRISIF